MSGPVDSLVASPVARLSGRCTVPGDKSISHRALIMGALTVGETRVTGLLEGDDVLRTAAALRALGAELERSGPGAWSISGRGVGGLAEADEVLDLGNSGTGVRLLMGVVAGHAMTSFFTGDESLRRRPMGRVARPLQEMGAVVVARAGDRLPLSITGRADLTPILYRTPVPSAQIKSAVLFAGLHAPGETTVVESQATRDHTERLLRQFGAEVRTERTAEGLAITVVGQPELVPAPIVVPGDPSSAAFLCVAGLIARDGEVTTENVGINPRRAAFLDTLREMGADLDIRPRGGDAGEPLADITVRAGPLAGIEVPAERAPDMIDEYPILAVAAAFARGTTRFNGIGELRVKESDRLGAMARGLQACGVAVEEGPDTLVVHGGTPRGGARIAAAHDHRIAMAFLVLGTAAAEAVRVDGTATIATSFPDFADLMTRLGARIAGVA